MQWNTPDNGMNLSSFDWQLDARARLWSRLTLDLHQRDRLDLNEANALAQLIITNMSDAQVAARIRETEERYVTE